MTSLTLKPDRGSLAIAATLAALTSASCGGGHTGTAPQALTAATVTYQHAGFAAGPAVFTDADGQVIEERRSEPFGAPIDARNRTPSGDVIGAHDVRRRDLNALNKRTEAATGWSDHGARWMAPETGRWLSADPPIEAPAARQMDAPWSLNPYQYAAQNPVAFWDPDGREPAGISEYDHVKRVMQAHGYAAALPLGPSPFDVMHSGWEFTATSTQSVGKPWVGQYLGSFAWACPGVCLRTSTFEKAMDQVAEIVVGHDTMIKRLYINDHGYLGMQDFGGVSGAAINFTRKGWDQDPVVLIHPDLLSLRGRFRPDGVLALGACLFAMDGDRDGSSSKYVLQYVSRALQVEVRAAYDEQDSDSNVLHGKVLACRGDSCVTGMGDSGVDAAWNKKFWDSFQRR